MPTLTFEARLLSASFTTSRYIPLASRSALVVHYHQLGMRRRETRVFRTPILVGSSHGAITVLSRYAICVFSQSMSWRRNIESWPNQAAAVNAPIASWFQFGHLWRRVTEQRR